MVLVATDITSHQSGRRFLITVVGLLGLHRRLRIHCPSQQHTQAAEEGKQSEVDTAGSHRPQCAHVTAIGRG